MKSHRIRNLYRFQHHSADVQANVCFIYRLIGETVFALYTGRVQLRFPTDVCADSENPWPRVES